MADVEAVLAAAAGTHASAPRRVLPTFVAPLAILLVALLTRAAAFGNPVVIHDDQFYLLVGDAMLGGAWPYIDIWDRKPVGLFVLYAGIAAVGGGSMLAMQIIATLFAAATALVIHRIARLFVATEPALLAALSYLLILPLLGGISGQTPVFYNLFVALAAWLLLSAAADPARPLVRHALTAMLLCGLAMSVKPVAAAEGAAIGLSFLWLLWRRGTRTPMLAAIASAMVTIALLPVVLPFLAYALRGDEARDAFVYANFVSIFDKHGFGAGAKFAGLAFFVIYAFPLLVVAALGLKACLAARGASPAAGMLVAWLIAAILGYLAVPSFFDHYSLPLLVPLSVLASFGFDRRIGRWLAAIVLAAPLLQGMVLDVAGNRDMRRHFAAASERIDQGRHGGCLYVADGPSWLYQSTKACRLTPYLFPHHLTLDVERDAVGVDQAVELKRILAQRPAVIVTRGSRGASVNPEVQKLLSRALATQYRTVHLVPGDAPSLIADLRVWQRRDLAPPADRPAPNLSLF